MTCTYARVVDIRVEPVGEVWVAFSPASGETVFLNDASAAILETLLSGPAEESAICSALSADSGMPELEIAARLAECWSRLIEVGLIREALPAEHRLQWTPTTRFRAGNSLT